ncbi:hypothetical protein MRX96_007246 [Rhipicephalus microplus]
MFGRGRRVDCHTCGVFAGGSSTPGNVSSGKSLLIGGWWRFDVPASLVGACTPLFSACRSFGLLKSLPLDAFPVVPVDPSTSPATPYGARRSPSPALPFVAAGKTCPTDERAPDVTGESGAPLRKGGHRSPFWPAGLPFRPNPALPTVEVLPERPLASPIAGGTGCSPDIALRLYNSVASTRTLYVVPLLGLKPTQRATLDVDHGGVVRRLFGLPRSSPIGPTLAETGQTLLSLPAKGAALRHLHRMHRMPEGRRFCCPTARSPALRHGRASARIPRTRQPNSGTLSILPHHDPGLAISTTIPDIWAKRTPLSASSNKRLQQSSSSDSLAASLSSPTARMAVDGAAAAACVVPALGLHE